MGGLGLAEFLNFGEGERRKFLSRWKNDGSIVVWLSTRAEVAYSTWVHVFPVLDVGKNEDGDEIELLRYPRFVSPDAEPIHASQFFRDESDRMKLPPRLDPFLRLREWLRHECQEPSDAVIFEWTNPKDGQLIQWRRGTLARLVKRGQSNFGHSLDTKLEWLFVVISDAAPGEGPQITRETRGLGEAVRAVIKAEMESNGEAGNPLLHPYAFKWKYDKNESISKMYQAIRYNQAQLTDAVREAITTTEFPDPTRDTKPRPGDKAKIRAAMEAAARIDLPWDRLFVPQWEDEADDSFDFGANAKRTPEVSNKAPAPAPVPAPTAATGPKTRRRKKKEEPKPPPVETIPCDDCGFALSVTATKCPKCGAEYEVEGDAPDPGIAAPAPAPAPEAAPDTKCWSCGGVVSGGTCVDCGLDVTDNMPFQ